LYDFDRNTGQFSNFEQIIISPEEIFGGGLAFSPSSQYLYVSTLNDLYQLDLWSGNIAASKILVGEYDGFLDPFETWFFRMQPGPDCRIYMRPGNSHFSWHVINKPDEPGLACDFRQHSFKLPFSNFRAMPYFPNYRLGTTPTYPCDSTIVVNLVTPVAEPEPIAMGVRVWPNPVKAGGVLRLELPEGWPEGKRGKVLLYDVLGRELLSEELVAGAGKLVLPESLEAGIYFYVLRSARGEVLSGKVVVE
jgi:hypothetical protein